MLEKSLGDTNVSVFFTRKVAEKDSMRSLLTSPTSPSMEGDLLWRGNGNSGKSMCIKKQGKATQRMESAVPSTLKNPEIISHLLDLRYFH